MFVGHLALGLAAKHVLPRVSLALLFVAVQFADLLWPLFLALGLEQVRIDPGNTAFTPLDFVSYPYSHSLLWLFVWGVLLGLIFRAFADDRRTFIVIVALVVSHWVLDVVTHRPDMPFYPRGPRVGLGLWNSIPTTVVVELVLYGAGVWLYLRATEAQDGIGRWSLTALAGFLVAAYLASINVVPPSVTALYLSAMAGAGVLTLWAWWADKHRRPRNLKSMSREPGAAAALR
jgi:hypothetical protein